MTSFKQGTGSTSGTSKSPDGAGASSVFIERRNALVNFSNIEIEQDSRTWRLSRQTTTTTTTLPPGPIWTATTSTATSLPLAISHLWSFPNPISPSAIVPPGLPSIPSSALESSTPVPLSYRPSRTSLSIYLPSRRQTRLFQVPPASTTIPTARKEFVAAPHSSEASGCSASTFYPTPSSQALGSTL